MKTSPPISDPKRAVVPPGAQFRRAVWDAMEEAEFWGDMTAPERAQAVAYLDLLPDAIVSNIGRAFRRVAKELVA